MCVCVCVCVCVLDFFSLSVFWFIKLFFFLPSMEMNYIRDCQFLIIIRYCTKDNHTLPDYMLVINHCYTYVYR